MKRLPLLYWIVAALLCAATALAHDVDGPGDCTRPSRDFGDAPDGDFAYPGVLGRFPTCMAPGSPAGIRQFLCPPISSAPGAANGFVRNENPAGVQPYWLGCTAAGLDLGIDSEGDGKTNSTGAPISSCNPNVPIDCIEPSWLAFGQDECYGDDDAGLAAMISFTTCQNASVSFRTYNCSPTARVVTLNILVDWNEDGDWNDNFECPGFPVTTCAYEWAVKNATIVLPPGCGGVTSPTFLAGPNAGRGWMRITISDNAVSDDFPWNGSSGMAGQILIGGETEDYPVTITGGQTGCDPYQDYGDAPEDLEAYASGVIGHFPTCIAPGIPATPDIECGPPPVFPPGLTGFVRHDAAATNPDKFWLGCPTPGFSGVDGELNGKVNTDPPFGFRSACDPSISVDCFETSWRHFGQDECYGDADAGIPAPLTFKPCEPNQVSFRAFSCSTQQHDVFLNILVDWNEDGDWTDNVLCGAAQPRCATEWAVQNVAIPINPGCNALASPLFLAGGKEGQGWLRITLTDVAVPDDFPWNGSVSMPNQSFRAGETEDYPIRIAQPLLGVRDAGPGRITLAAATPNPSRNWTQLSWSQPRAAHASLVIYDVIGRRVAKLVDAEMTAGEHRASWSFKGDDGGTVPPGVYLAKLRIGNEEQKTQIVRLR